MTLQKEHGDKVEMKIFLLADAVFCGVPNQNTPNGYYNFERMLKVVIRNGGEVISYESLPSICCSIPYQYPVFCLGFSHSLR